MRIPSLKDAVRIPRLLWRDFIMASSDATMSFDDLIQAYFFTDTAYQYTWSKLEVHQTLLKDEVRVGAFRDALKETVKPDYNVLDIGTGTGILAFLAADAGAKRVLGVDSANIIEVAKKAALRNHAANVEFVRADIRDVSGGGFDLIICELLGMQVLDEGITYKVKKAKRLLKEGGRLMPSTIDIYAAPIECPDAGLGFWRNLYGIDYSVVESVPHEVRNLDLSRSRLLDEPQKIASIDLMEGSGYPVRFTGTFSAKSDGEFHGCVMYFAARLSENVTLSTDPRKPITHWKHIFLPNDRRRQVKKGDRISAEIKSHLNDTRWKWKYPAD